MTEKARLIVEISKTVGHQIRMHYSSGMVSPWGAWISQPAPSYLELQGVGPEPLSALLSIDFDPIKEEYLGKLLPRKRRDRSEQIMQMIQAANLEFTVLNAEGSVIRVRLD